MTLKKQFYTLCYEEKEMHDFVQYFTSTTGTSLTDVSHLANYSNTVIYILRKVIQNPSDYDVFKAFCESRAPLQKYLQGMKVETTKLGHVSFEFCDF